MPSLNIALAGIDISSYHGEKMNALRVAIKGIVIYFSYNTPVAFHHKAKVVVVSENCWQNTTGKHIAEIERIWTKPKSGRTPRQEFEKLLNEALTAEGLA